MIVLDTTVLVDHLRRDPTARDALSEATRRGRVAASVASRIEVLRGMRPGEEDAVWALFAALEWVDVDARVADVAGTFARQYKRSHASVDPIDYVIAATATVLGAELWTHNVRHFPMFAGLQPPY